MGGAWVRVPLYLAALATGGSFAILFTGDFLAWFPPSSIVAVGGGAFWAMVLATLVGALVGSAGRYRFVLLLPVTVLYTFFAVYGWPPLFSYTEWRDQFYRGAADVYQAFAIMYNEPVPYDIYPGLFVVLIPVVMIVVAFATSATLYEESPIISVAVLGVTIGVLSTISFEDGAGPFFAVFLVCAVTLLLSPGSRRPGPAGLLAGALVVALVLAVPRLPLADATISPGFIDWTRIVTGGTSRLNVQADVGDYLTSGRDAEIMKVRSSEPLLWRGGTLDYFDGIRWWDTTEPGAEDGEEISPNVETQPVRQHFEVLNAHTDLIFGGYKIDRTSEPAAAQNSDGSWSLPDSLEEGSSYEVISRVPQPTAAQLENAGTDYPPLVREKFLQLPDNRPEVIAETARMIQNDYDPQTPYETARAIERYLIYDGGFVYSLDVSYGRADKAIEEFLGDSKQGFCTQFATSMALLLRESDVPSRVVYGSTTGQEIEPGEYLVTGSNIHTWVEVYFPGVGWYPFDPTPGFSMPSTMEANAPRPAILDSSQNLSPENPALSGRVQDEVDTPRQRPDPLESGNAAASRGEMRTVPWPLLVLVPVLLAAAVPLGKKALRARGRPEDLYRDLTGRLRDVLPPGRTTIADSPALTPTERIMLLAGAVGIEEGPMEEFARAYSDHLYSADPGSHRVSSAYRRAMGAYEALPRWRRTLGAANPASLLVRAMRYVSSVRMRLAKALRGKFRKSASH